MNFKAVINFFSNMFNCPTHGGGSSKQTCDLITLKSCYSWCDAPCTISVISEFIRNDDFRTAMGWTADTSDKDAFDEIVAMMMKHFDIE